MTSQQVHHVPHHWYTWFGHAAPYFYTWGLVSACVLRLILILGFVMICLIGTWRHPLRTLRSNWRMLGSRAPEEHKALLDLFDTDRNIALTVGSLGLAAWSVLTAFHPAGIDSRSLGLELLFVGVILSIAGPLVFRVEGSDGSLLGLESIVTVGYVALIFALASLLVEVFDRPWLSAVGIGIVVLMVVREAMEVIAQARLTWPYIQPPAPKVRTGSRPIE